MSFNKQTASSSQLNVSRVFGTRKSVLTICRRGEFNMSQCEFGCFAVVLFRNVSPMINYSLVHTTCHVRRYRFSNLNCQRLWYANCVRCEFARCCDLGMLVKLFHHLASSWAGRFRWVRDGCPCSDGNIYDESRQELPIPLFGVHSSVPVFVWGQRSIKTSEINNRPRGITWLGRIKNEILTGAPQIECVIYTVWPLGRIKWSKQRSKITNTRFRKITKSKG